MSACLFALASLHLACGEISDSPGAAGPVVETEIIGDTTVVRTVSGSVWKGNATLVPEVAVGELDGPEEYLFGSVRAITVDDDHNVYVLDDQAGNVRVFDSFIRHLRHDARAGVSEGRYQAQVEMLRQWARDKYGPEAAESLESLLNGPDDQARVAVISRAIVECDSAAAFLKRARSS